MRLREITPRPLSGQRDRSAKRNLTPNSITRPTRMRGNMGRLFEVINDKRPNRIEPINFEMLARSKATATTESKTSQASTAISYGSQGY
jgi:hypothetical protein